MISGPVETNKHQHNLELWLENNSSNQTICSYCYSTNPLRLSSPFRLEGALSARAYYYLINTSPGLLAGDRLNLELKLESNSQLYLTEQAATKVHSMPQKGTLARVNYSILLKEHSSLELVTEPIILYANSTLEQQATIKLDPTAQLFISEIILPGRLAKNEFYKFNYFDNRLQIQDLAGNLLFADATKILGKDNPFASHNLYASYPVMASAIIILPGIELHQLIKKVEKLKPASGMTTGTSILPGAKGILIRVLGTNTVVLKRYLRDLIDYTRRLTDQPKLPYVPK